MKEKKKVNGKLIFLIAIAIIAVLLIILGIALSMNTKKIKSEIQIKSTDDLQNLINTVYEGLESTLPPTLNTQVIDVNNVDVLRSFTGLVTNKNIDCAVVSEPMVGAQAYSFVLVKVKDGIDSNTVAKEMFENIDTRKWICVQAEKLYATSLDNLALLVMASDEWATPVYNKLKEVLGAHFEEYTKVNSDEFTENQLHIET